ncbi:IS110 family transposase [Saccharopolyspora hirsuta]|uniref:IS110 family transposase n=1 Tax=Saccharopolyspora hirsuta TaxID=1837 RepID=A0A5M7B4X0_SACHI|nr:IS110 family transposase [Saccharopolyspora hirsuta]KAA5824573.1 IS110 family transposase [Saccharopolyspora hirsuta]
MRVWVGIDVGKEVHWAWVVDDEGTCMLSRRVANDETDLLTLIAEVTELGANEITWAVDLTTAESALLLAILWSHGQKVRYLPGKAVNRAAAGYRSEGKTDAKDARIIADQARMRRDLIELRAPEELVVELRMLSTRRADVVADRTRTINRLRQQLTAICPALERAADLTGQRGWIRLLARYQRPKALRRAGVARLRRLLVGMGGLRESTAAAIAEAAVQAAKSQTTRLPGEDVTAELIAGLAEEVMRLDEHIAELDAAIEARFRRHRLAEVITSLPGMGFRLGAEFLAATGDMTWFASADHLAAYAGLAPVPHDSGKRTGRLHRPTRYNRALRRVFYISALTSIRCDPTSRAYYDKKRAEGKRAKGAILALARRRVDVLWALIRDHRTWQPTMPSIAAQAA